MSYRSDVRHHLEEFIDQHRLMLAGCLEGLSEEEARAALVPSRTTLLGVVKHATFVEQVWFDEAITGRPRAEIGCATTPDESFVLTHDDTITSVLKEYERVCALSRAAAAGLELDDVVCGNRRGRLSVHWIFLHVLRELAQHCGHADILREQILHARLP